MTNYPLMFAGPIVGVLALSVWAIPKTRPQFLSKSIASLAVCSFVPLVAASALHSYVLAIVAFAARPFVALMGGVVSMGYLIRCRDGGFPAATAVSPMFLIVGASVDLYSVYVFLPFFDGGAC